MIAGASGGGAPTMEPRIDPFVPVDHGAALIRASWEVTAGDVIAFQPIADDRRPPCQRGPETGETRVWRAREPVGLGPRGHFDGLIVMTVGAVLAPAVIRRDALDRQ